VLETINDKSIELFDYQDKPLNRDLIYKLTNEKEVTKVFHFWASWCDPCAIELPELISYAKKISQDKASKNTSGGVKGLSEANSAELSKDVANASGASGGNVQIYLVSLDSDFEGLSKFTKIFPEIASKDFIQVWDKNNSLSARYGVDKLPMTVFIFPDGRIEIHEGVVSWKNLSL